MLAIATRKYAVRPEFRSRDTGADAAD